MKATTALPQPPLLVGRDQIDQGDPKPFGTVCRVEREQHVSDVHEDLAGHRRANMPAYVEVDLFVRFDHAPACTIWWIRARVNPAAAAIIARLTPST